MIERTLKKLSAFFFLLVVLLLKLPVINTPHHWDSIFLVGGSRHIYEHGLISGLGPFDFGHPPLLHYILAVIWRLCGYSLWISHLVIFIFSFAGIYFTYLLGKEMKDEAAGILAALLLFFSPLYFAQSGTVNLDIPAAAFAAAALYAALRDKTGWYLIFGTCLVMTKEIGLLMIAGLLIYIYAKGEGRSRLALLLKLLVYSIPITLFLCWFIYHRYSAGWFISPLFVFRAGWAPTALLQRAYELFLADWRWATSACIVYAAFSKRGLFGTKRYLPLLISIFLCLAAFASFIDQLPRYMVAVYPFYYVIAAISLVGLFSGKRLLFYGVALILLALSMSGWYGQRSNQSTGSGAMLESNLEYLDILDTHMAAARFIADNYPSSTVIAGWPQVDELRYPYLGYAVRPVKCIYFSEVKGDILEKAELVYYSEQSHDALDMKEWMGTLDLEILAGYERNNKSAAVYRIVKGKR